MNEQITNTEQERLLVLEETIQKGKETFVEVGNALAEIRDSRIYRQQYKTFESYCRDRWGFNRDYVNKIIRSAVVISNLDTNVSKPTTESQARPLAKLPPEKQPEAWAKAQEKAKQEGKSVTAKHVQEAVHETSNEEEPQALVVDEVKAGPIRILQSNGLGIFAAAKIVMERISKTDTQRIEALEKMIAYCQDRISQNQ